MTFRVLHFALDEKFIPLIQGLFEEAFPGGNQFRIQSDAPRLAHVKSAPNVVQVGAEYFHSPDAQSDLRRCDGLVVHGLTPECAPAVAAAPEGVRVLWAGWGFDYAPLLEPRLGPLLLPQTRRLFRGRTALDRVRYFLGTPSKLARIRRKLRRWRMSAGAMARSLPDVAGRIDLFSLVTPDEAELVREAVPALRARFHALLYATTEDSLAPGPERMEGPDVLVGNSATPTNNHAEAFDALRRLDLGGRRIIVPLSYGSPAYADAVCRLGRRLFGPAFVALRTFMPLAEFNELQKNCGTVIMNHRRQQAVGTLSAALFKGARVFLRPENPVFGYYSRLGIALSGIDELAQRPASVFEPLDAAARQRNRSVLGDLLRRSRAVDAIRRIPDGRA